MVHMPIERGIRALKTKNDNPFEDMTDADALDAARQMTETAAFNLAFVLPSDVIAELIQISHQISVIQTRLEDALGTLPQTADTAPMPVLARTKPDTDGVDGQSHDEP